MAGASIKKSVKILANSYLRLLESKEGLRINAAYIFGSQAKGKARPESDIDICIVSPQFKSPGSALRWLWRKKPLAFSKIEPVGYAPQQFNPRLNPLIAEIKKTGIRIK